VIWRRVQRLPSWTVAEQADGERRAAWLLSNQEVPGKVSILSPPSRRSSL